MTTELPPPQPSRPGAIRAEVADVHPGPMPSRLPNPWALFAVGVGISALIAAVSGGSVGVVVAATSNADCAPADGWCELGGALLGLLIGVTAGVIAYIVAGIVVIRRCRPAGARTGHMIAHLVAPIATLMVLSVLSSVL